MDEQIDSVYTDRAYDTKRCRQLKADRQANAVIPPRKNAKPCIKLLGDKLNPRHFQSQVNEIHARVAVLNKFTDLGRPHSRVLT